MRCDIHFVEQFILESNLILVVDLSLRNKTTLLITSYYIRIEQLSVFEAKLWDLIETKTVFSGKNFKCEALLMNDWFRHAKYGP